jgi:hypothetical protein
MEDRVRVPLTENKKGRKKLINFLRLEWDYGSWSDPRAKPSKKLPYLGYTRYKIQAQKVPDPIRLLIHNIRLIQHYLLRNKNKNKNILQR